MRNNYLIHSKIYIIDDKISYTGSVNFTHNGLFKSVENITKHNKEETNYLIKIFKEIYNKNLYYKNIQEWGKYLYENE